MQQIALRPLATLIPYARNSRTHSEAQVAQIAASLDAFGMVGAIVVRDGVIAKGHGTLAAIRQLQQAGKRLYPAPGREAGAQPFDDGLCPVLDVSGWSEAQFRAYVIADNRLAELAGWDVALLRLELDALDVDGFDLDLTGFDAIELGKLIMPDAASGLTEDDDAPPIAEQMVSQPGDVWLCGNHRVMCGDSTLLADVQCLMHGDVADLIVTDPPYNVAYEGKTSDKLTIKNDAMPADAFAAFLGAAFNAMYHVAGDGAGVYVFHADSEGMRFREAMTNAGFKLAQCCVWVKQNIVFGRQDYHWQHEPVLYGWKPTAAHRWYTDRKQSTVWHFDRPQRNDVHPTMKPVALVEYPIRNSSQGDDIVLDLFGGSGTTLIACEKNRRAARLMELDPHYCDVIVRRWQAFTGQQATRLADGMTFDATQAQ